MCDPKSRGKKGGQRGVSLVGSTRLEKHPGCFGSLHLPIDPPFASLLLRPLYHNRCARCPNRTLAELGLVMLGLEFDLPHRQILQGPFAGGSPRFRDMSS